MTKKTMLLALVALSAAMLALPALASAGTWNIHNKAGVAPTAAVPLPFTFASPAGNVSRLTGSNNIKCNTFKGKGKYTSSTTGVIEELEFAGCSVEAFGGEACTSAGAAAGTIKTITPNTFHNIRLEPGTDPDPVKATEEKHKLGILITPKELTPSPSTEGQFATFNCKVFGIGLAVNVEGNGIIGQITEPTCGVTSKTATLVFDRDPITTTQQRWLQITTAGTKYDLTSSVNNGAFETAVEDAHGTITFGEEATAVCP